MKKFVCFFLIIIFGILFCGCALNNVQSISQKLNTYTIEAEWDEEKKELNARQNLLYINNEELPLKELCFHIYANAYRQDAQIKPINNQSLAKAYPNGISYGGIDIKKTMIGGKDCEFKIEGEDMDILTITLEEEIYPDEKISVDIEYTVKLANVLHRLGYGKNAVNFGNWYPILCVYENGEYKKTPYYSNGDPFYSDCANYNVKITAPQSYKGAFTGKITQSVEGGKITYSATARAVRDFAFVLSKDFNIVTAKLDDIEIIYYYYNDESFEQSLQIAKESLQTFIDLFGEYKYSTLSVVQTGFLHGGMEYPTLIYISDTLQQESYFETIVHETAHQWWYAVVGSDQVSHAWLDEGLTEYSTVLFYEKNPGYQKTRDEMIKQTLNSYKFFVDIFEQIAGNVDTSMNRAVNEFSSEHEYIYMTYVKGELMYDSLRTNIGYDKFIKGLKRYYKDNCFRHATPQTQIAAFERASGTELNSFFNSWLEGKAII
jgi:hypothetical protein